MQMNDWNLLLKCRFWFKRYGFCIYDKLPGNAKAAGPCPLKLTSCLLLELQLFHPHLTPFQHVCSSLPALLNHSQSLKCAGWWLHVLVHAVPCAWNLPCLTPLPYNAHFPGTQLMHVLFWEDITTHSPSKRVNIFLPLLSCVYYCLFCTILQFLIYYELLKEVTLSHFCIPSICMVLAAK